MPSSIVRRIAALGSEFNSNQYKLVCLAAEYDVELEWFQQAREWIRVGHALGVLPRIDQAFRSDSLSYAKTRILTRWADPENEQELIDLANGRTANRLTTAVANYLARGETDTERDNRHHDNRSVTVHTDVDGMVIIRAALPPDVGKQVAEAVNTIVQQVASTPAGEPTDRMHASADPHLPRSVVEPTACSCQNASADASLGPTMNEQLHELKKRWRPVGHDDSYLPSLAQQRADAFVLLFLGTNTNLVTEVVIHVRGDGTTFDDGPPITNNAVCQRLDQSFIRMMIHDRQRRPIDASNRRRYPTPRQKRVVLEVHNHECVDCQSTDLLELDHNPPFHRTQHTVTTELEPRCAPCHRVRHRRDRAIAR